MLHRIHGRLPHPTAGSRTARGRVHVHPPHRHHGRQDRRPVLWQRPDRQRDHHRYRTVGHQRIRHDARHVRYEHEPIGRRRRLGIRQLDSKTARSIHPEHVLHERIHPHRRTLRQRDHRTLAGRGKIQRFRPSVGKHQVRHRHRSRKQTEFDRQRQGARRPLGQMGPRHPHPVVRKRQSRPTIHRPQQLQHVGRALLVVGHPHQ